MRALIHDKFNLRYFIPIVLCLLLIVGFLSSGAIQKSTKPLVSTKIGRMLAVGNQSEAVVFERAEYYEKSNLLITTFYLKSSDVVPTDTLKVESFNGKTEQKIENNVEKINANYYVVFTPNVSPSFRQIGNNLTVTDNQNNTQKVGAIGVTQKNVTKINSEYQAQPFQYYLSQYKTYAVKDVNALDKTLKQEIAKYNAQIKELNKENQQYLADMDYKTGDQQQEIQAKISANNSAVDNINQQIQSVKDQQKKLDEQRKILDTE